MYQHVSTGDLLLPSYFPFILKNVLIDGCNGQTRTSIISLFSMTGKWFPHSLMYSDKEALSRSGKKMIHWQLMGRFCARLNIPNTKKWHHVPSPCFGMCLIGFRTDEEPGVHREQCSGFWLSTDTTLNVSARENHSPKTSNLNTTSFSICTLT